MSVFKRLKNASVDLTTLSVKTFTGSIQAAVNTETGEGVNIIDWDAMLKNAASESATVRVVAITEVQIGGDAHLFVADDASAELVEIHNHQVAESLLVTPQASPKTRYEGFIL